MITAPNPQYVQVADLLRQRIDDGTYPGGSLLPSEDRLADEFGLSRVTINRAIGLLRASGDVRVKRGVGTVVRAFPRIVRDAKGRYAARSEGTGAADVEIRRMDRQPRTEYVRIGKVTPTTQVAAVLGLDRRDTTLLRARVMYADDEPTQIADSYFPWSLVRSCKALLKPDAGPGGSYGRLAEIGCGPVRFTEDVTVRIPTKQEQASLELDATLPVFEIWHVAYTTDDRPVEVCIHVMPGHLWQLRYAWADDTGSDDDRGVS